MSTEPPLTALTAEALDPLFWQPARHDVDSAWFGHVPFAHWLVSVHRPASIVELGAHNGVSYAAFCEAVLRCKLDARALAVDTWRGDEHAGFYGDEVYAGLKQFHDQRYAAFSTLLRSTFDDARRFVPDGSVDLLHIDGRHRYEDVSHDFATWGVKLSDRAVVLFHDTNVHEHDFGVWRLWSELRAAHPSFEFLHGHGLGVLAVGPALDGPAAALCALADRGAVNTLRERFATLGDRWIAARDLRTHGRVIAHLQGALAKTGEDLAQAKHWGEAAQNEVNTLFPQLQKLTGQHRAARASLAQLRHDVAARDLQLAELEEQAASRRMAHEAERGRLQAERGRLQEEAALAAMRLDAAQAALAGVREQRDALERERAVLFASTSWRITGPVRRLAGRRGGLSPALPAAPLALAAPVDVSPVDVSTILVSPILASHLETAPSPAAPAASEQPTGAAEPRALFISGEDHTPGHTYRIERYVAAARDAGFDARWTAPEPVGPAELAGVKLVVLWRVPFSAHIQGIITVTHEQGGTVIFDVDDLMFRPDMATVEIIDGIRSQKFSEFDTQAFFTRIGRTLRACDLVTCPTQELAHQARRLGRPAYVLPNGFDAGSHAVARDARLRWAAEPDDLLRIGYAGGSRTHQRDFAVAAPAILRVLQEMPQARLTLFRDPSSGEGLVLMDEFPAFAALADRIEWRNMVPLAELPRELARFTVNIAPLQPDNPFCEAKSELKFFEAALAGVPTVASPSGPFARAIEDGVTGYLAVSEQDWHTALRGLLDDPALRDRMAQAAYHVSLARFGPEARADAFKLMLAQWDGGAAGAAAFERERYAAALPRLRPPAVPESETIFAADRQGAAEVAVIVPVFNYADYVLEALASVAAQTLAALDLVVIDDCSPDDSMAMLLGWVQANAHRFNRVSVLRHRANAGLGFARNSGFAAAETPFVLPLDADNRLRPAACETLLGHLRAGEAAFAYPAIQQFGDKTEVFGRDPYSVLRLQLGNYIDAMAMVRKTAWAAAGGYDHVQHGWEDFDFWCRLAERGQYGCAVPDILADYRVHNKSMLHTATEIQGNRADLVRDMQARHPWLDLA